MEGTDEYRMARRVSMVEVRGGRVRGLTEVRLDRWCEGGLGRQGDDG